MPVEVALPHVGRPAVGLAAPKGTGTWGPRDAVLGEGGVQVRDPCSQLLAPLPAAVWNFPRTSEHHLPLQIGETVHILQASEGKGVRQPWPSPVPSPAIPCWVGTGVHPDMGPPPPSLGRTAGGHPSPNPADSIPFPPLAGWYRGYSLRNRAAQVGEGLLGGVGHGGGCGHGRRLTLPLLGGRARLPAGFPGWDPQSQGGGPWLWHPGEGCVLPSPACVC